ncbi:MAG: hypothetical protein M3511_10920 [Deinococcota bacterium]|nr:hypothetical protein [Deinococcota bacterium]
MLELARRFISSKDPSHEEALWGLRLLFSGAFLFQLGFAAMFGLVLTLIALPSPRASSAFMQVLQALTVINLFFGLITSFFTALSGGKKRAQSAALLLGSMLATPVWFMLLAAMTGGDARYLQRLGLLLALYFPLGFFVAGHYAHFARRPPQKTGRQEERARRDG